MAARLSTYLLSRPAYQVTAPLIFVSTHSGEKQLHRGALLPQDTFQNVVDHLIKLGYIAPLTESEAL